MQVLEVSQTEMVRNILAVLGQAHDTEITDGRCWYQAAHTFAIGLADVYDLPITHACGIIAALSPRIGWGANMRAAEAVCTGRKPGAAFPDNVRKAERIRAGESPNDVLKGHKVTAFYANILRPRARDASGPVTVDVHAVAAALGRVFHKPAAPPRIDRLRPYYHVAAAYRLAARETQFSPHELQAIVWVTWRRMHSSPAQFDN